MHPSARVWVVAYSDNSGIGRFVRCKTRNPPWESYSQSISSWKMLSSSFSEHGMHIHLPIILHSLYHFTNEIKGWVSALEHLRESPI